jgi:hypothetical protein
MRSAEHLQHVAHGGDDQFVGELALPWSAMALACAMWCFASSMAER